MLEPSGASLRIFRGPGVAHDPHRRIVRHHPLGDPEVTLRLPFVLSVAHRDVDGLAGIGDVDDELRRAIALAGGWIERGHPEPDWLAPLELVVQQTIAR